MILEIKITPAGKTAGVRHLIMQQDNTVLQIDYVKTNLLVKKYLLPNEVWSLSRSMISSIMIPL